MTNEPKYIPGQTVFLSGANKSLIKEAKVWKYSGGLYTIKFIGGGGTRVRESRLLPTREAAEKLIKEREERLRRL